MRDVAASGTEFPPISPPKMRCWPEAIALFSPTIMYSSDPISDSLFHAKSGSLTLFAQLST